MNVHRRTMAFAFPAVAAVLGALTVALLLATPEDSGANIGAGLVGMLAGLAAVGAALLYQP